MGEAVAVLLVLATGVVALRAVLDGVCVGVPASIVVLAPASEAARLVRSRPRAVPVLGGAGLLAASVLRVVALDLPDAVVWFVAADVLWWVAGALLVRGIGLRYLGRALAVEVPLLLALAVPLVAGRADLPLAVEAPVAFLSSSAAGSCCRGPSHRALPGRDSSSARGSPRRPVSAAAVAAALFLPVGLAWLVGGTVALTALLVLAERRFPVLRPPLVARLSLRVLLPLAAAQLATVVALTLLAG